MKHYYLQCYRNNRNPSLTVWVLIYNLFITQKSRLMFHSRSSGSCRFDSHFAAIMANLFILLRTNSQSFSKLQSESNFRSRFSKQFLEKLALLSVHIYTKNSSISTSTKNETGCIQGFTVTVLVYNKNDDFIGSLGDPHFTIRTPHCTQALLPPPPPPGTPL